MFPANLVHLCNNVKCNNPVNFQFKKPAIVEILMIILTGSFFTGTHHSIALLGPKTQRYIHINISTSNI